MSDSKVNELVSSLKFPLWVESGHSGSPHFQRKRRHDGRRRHCPMEQSSSGFIRLAASRCDRTGKARSEERERDRFGHTHCANFCKVGRFRRRTKWKETVRAKAACDASGRFDPRRINPATTCTQRRSVKIGQCIIDIEYVENGGSTAKLCDRQRCKRARKRRPSIDAEGRSSSKRVQRRSAERHIVYCAINNQAVDTCWVGGRTHQSWRGVCAARN